MADYAISNVPRRVVYAPSGVGPYAFTFEILNQTDIAVYKASTLLTLTTDYTVTINANGTGSVTLVVTAGTSNITIVGSKNIQRTTDFTTGGDLFANTLNDELDNQTIFIQQVAETAERGLKAPVTDPTDIAMTLPAKDGRKGKVLAFDSTTGNPVAGPALDAVVTVIEQSANINTVATNIGSVNTVAGNTSNINTVAGVSSNVTTVAANIANVNAVGADLLEATSEINTVAVDIANVNNVGNNIGNVNTVAGISANVTTVAGVSSNVSTVATNIASVNTNATNIVSIQNASTNATNAASSASAAATSATNASNSASAASTSATNASNSATAASTSASNAATSETNSASSATASAASAVSAASSAASAAALLDNFDDRYLGPKASDPALDNDGNALLIGALYFNTTDGVMKVYTASGWIAASSASVATLATFEFVATSGQTVFSGNDANGASLSYVAPALIVTLNGVRLRPGDDYTATNGTSITLVSAAALNDELVVDAFGSFLVANTYTISEVDAFAVKLTGAQTVAGVKTFSSQPVFSAGIDLGSSGQIRFPATQLASSNANTLDDYEEGTFTPVIGGSTTNPTITYDAQSGFYTKIGNVVSVLIYLQTSARSGGSGSLVITGLPFAQSSTANRFGGNALFYAVNSGLATASLFPNGASGNTIFTILASKNDGSNWGDVPVTNIPNSLAAIKIQITYLVDY